MKNGSGHQDSAIDKLLGSVCRTSVYSACCYTGRLAFFLSNIIWAKHECQDFSVDIFVYWLDYPMMIMLSPGQ